MCLTAKNDFSMKIRIDFQVVALPNSRTYEASVGQTGSVLASILSFKDIDLFAKLGTMTLEKSLLYKLLN